jgi:hypothetical protein
VRYIVPVVPSTMAAARALAATAAARSVVLREVDAAPGAAVFEVVRNVQPVPNTDSTINRSTNTEPHHNRSMR